MGIWLIVMNCVEVLWFHLVNSTVLFKLINSNLTVDIFFTLCTWRSRYWKHQTLFSIILAVNIIFWGNNSVSEKLSECSLFSNIMCPLVLPLNQILFRGHLPSSSVIYLNQQTERHGCKRERETDRQKRRKGGKIQDGERGGDVTLYLSIKCWPWFLRECGVTKFLVKMYTFPLRWVFHVVIG